jgi:hypothetical protein
VARGETVNARRAFLVAIVLVLLAGLKFAGAQQTAPPAPSLKEQLVGTWRLVARDIVRPDGSSTPDPAYGTKYPIGYIMYDHTGHMAVQFMALDRPDGESARGYNAYFGTYTLDETSRPPKVTHHMEGSLDPRDIGQDAVRDVLLNGDELKIVVHNTRNANVNVNTFRRVR